MQHIDESKLETDLEYRFQFLADFIGFGPDDVALIHAVAAPMFAAVDDFVEATYAKLLSYDATARHFVQRGAGFQGDVAASLPDLHQQQEQIQFRKDHLKSYFMHILGRPYDAGMIKYLDAIAKMHTARGGNSKIQVPAVQMNAFMGMLSGLFSERIMTMDLDRDTALRTMRAFQKLLWIQNDFINRYYQNAITAG